MNKLIQWFKRNACKDCDYYCPENNVCQTKKCETCGCHPYVNWFDRHFCEPYKAESENKKYKVEVITRGNCMICGKELTDGLFFCKECEDKASSRKREINMATCIIPELNLKNIIAESREVAQALNEFADTLEQIEKKYAEVQDEDNN